MIKKIALLFLIVFLFGKKTNAQEVDIFRDSSSFERPKFAIIFTPSALAHLRIPATQLGVEINIGRYITLLQEGAFIFKKRKTDISNQKGFRIRTEGRVFLNEYEVDYINVVIGIQYRKWKFKYDASDTFCRFNCLYQQRLNYTVNQKAHGANLTFGILHSTKSGFQIEMGGGIGKIFRTNSPENLPDDAELISRRVNIFNRPNGEAFEADEISLLLWMKIGYAF